MAETWTLEKIYQLISNQVQESLKLEYKSAGALEKTDEKKKEITKDVSAMANSDGGTIIYGIKEYDEKDKRHLPERIDNIDQSKITKEWLEQIVNTIRPKIEGVIITPISIDNENSCVYVLEIPKGETAYQAQDFRYYKRFNFLATPMEDYEIRDVMSRNKNPRFILSFVIEKSTSYYNNLERIMDSNESDVKNDIPKVENANFSLLITAKNVGAVYAKYVNAFFYIPCYIINDDNEDKEIIKDDDGIRYYKDYEDNTVREVVYSSSMIQEYGPARFDPILPSLSITWEIPLKHLGDILPRGRFDSNEKLKWTLHADNAIPVSGEIYLNEIEFNII